MLKPDFINEAEFLKLCLTYHYNGLQITCLCPEAIASLAPKCNTINTLYKHIYFIICFHYCHIKHSKKYLSFFEVQPYSLDGKFSPFEF